MNFIDQFLESFQVHSKNLAVIDGDIRYSYEDIAHYVLLAINDIKKCNLNKGSNVVLRLNNSVEFIAYYLAVLTEGCVVVPINTLLKNRELEAIADHCEAGLIIGSGQGIDIKEKYYVDADELKMKATHNLEKKPICDAFPRSSSASSEDFAAIIYTSGTTGMPKGVVLTHENLRTNTAAILKYLPVLEDDKTLATLPFCYSYGLSVLNTHLLRGACLVISRISQFPPRVVELLIKENVTSISAVASFFNLIVSKSNILNNQNLTIRYITNAGGPISNDLIVALQSGFPNAKIYLMYGQTEATARISYLPPDKLSEKGSSAGIPLDGLEIEIRDNLGNVNDSDVSGEIYVRGPNLMRGYWSNISETEKVLINGWLKTGDLGYKDKEGFLYIKGRKSEIIKVNSIRISPYEIENVINMHPDVDESAVIGVPDSTVGEKIVAFVVRRNNDLDEQEIKKHCALELAKFKCPKQIKFVHALPKTTSGKIKRNSLKLG